MMRHTLTMAAAAASLWSPATAQDVSSSSCVDGLYMIVARGTNEEPGTGVTGLVAERIAERIDDSEVVGLDYPATFTDPLYPQSVEEGTEQLSDVVRSYTEDCPDGKIAIFGYSQGAHIVSNVVCGSTSLTFGGDTPALPRDLVEDNIVAIVLFGDPSHDASAPYNLGTSENNGLFPRPNITACEQYTFLKSYCDTGDVYCDGGDIRAVHGEYVQKYGQEVVEDVIEAWNNATDSNDDTDPGPAFGDEASTSITETPGASTPTETPASSTSSETQTESQTETQTESSAETPTESGEGETVDDDGAAVGLSAASSLVFGAPLMLMALWNVL